MYSKDGQEDHSRPDTALFHDTKRLVTNLSDIHRAQYLFGREMRARLICGGGGWL